MTWNADIACGEGAEFRRSRNHHSSGQVNVTDQAYFLKILKTIFWWGCEGCAGTSENGRSAFIGGRTGGPDDTE